MTDSNTQLAARTDVVPAVEVITEPVKVWVIGLGEWSDTEPIAAVQGTESDAERVVEKLRAQHPGYPVSLWREVEFFPAPLHG